MHVVAIFDELIRCSKPNTLLYDESCYVLTITYTLLYIDLDEEFSLRKSVFTFNSSQLLTHHYPSWQLTRKKLRWLCRPDVAKRQAGPETRNSSILVKSSLTWVLFLLPTLRHLSIRVTKTQLTLTPDVAEEG